MSGPVITDPTCATCRRLPPASLRDGRVHLFVVGEDTRVGDRLLRLRLARRGHPAGQAGSAPGW